MRNVNGYKHEIQLSQWKKTVMDQVSSGLTVTAYCAKNNISRNSFNYWLRLVRERSIGQLPAEVKNTLPISEAKEEVSFKKLEVQSPANGFQPAVVIHLPMATVDINPGVDKQTVEAVLLALKAIC